MRTGAANGIGAAQCTCATLTDPDASRIKPIRTRSRYPAVLFYLSPTPAPRSLPTFSCLLLPANFPLGPNLSPSLLFVLARAQVQQPRDNRCSMYFAKRKSYALVRENTRRCKCELPYSLLLSSSSSFVIRV